MKSLLHRLRAALLVLTSKQYVVIAGGNSITALQNAPTATAIEWVDRLVHRMIEKQEEL